jgi:hypothetical protein
MPDDLASAIVNHDEMVRSHPAATATTPANFVHNGFLSFHDGAKHWHQNASETLMGDTNAGTKC